MSGSDPAGGPERGRSNRSAAANRRVSPTGDGDRDETYPVGVHKKTAGGDSRARKTLRKGFKLELEFMKEGLPRDTR